MGNSQSNSSEAVAQKVLVEQLTALQLRNRVMKQEPEKEYVHVDLIEYAPVDRGGSQTVSISAAEQWEKELLEDPKNRYESPCLRLENSYTD
jgi:bleomycin hydrolase